MHLIKKLNQKAKLLYYVKKKRNLNICLRIKSNISNYIRINPNICHIVNALWKSNYSSDREELMGICL
jgi:hypothetical protein